ncbi:hypothetical protein LZ30DRAFT_255133 [Colletotrichum cereale]|nr:hypothetical protein LZ30DRAFT_255133 [Colletotrichum cereale]
MSPKIASADPPWSRLFLLVLIFDRVEGEGGSASYFVPVSPTHPGCPACPAVAARGGGVQERAEARNKQPNKPHTTSLFEAASLSILERPVCPAVALPGSETVSARWDGRCGS